MTRVAWLNPEMWSELFLDNRDNLLRELDILSENLDAYRRALRDGDRAQLIRLLQEGKERKEAVDGK
jgi:prephenate dehydrogenase